LSKFIICGLTLSLQNHFKPDSSSSDALSNAMKHLWFAQKSTFGGRNAVILNRVLMPRTQPRDLFIPQTRPWFFVYVLSPLRDRAPFFWSWRWLKKGLYFLLVT